MKTKITAKWFAIQDMAGDLHPTWCSKCAPTSEENVVPMINIDPAIWTCAVCHKSLIEIIDQIVNESSTWAGFSARLKNMGFSVVDVENEIEHLMNKYGI